MSLGFLSRHKTAIGCGVLTLCLLIAVRLALPPFLLKKINGHLATFSADYSLHIGSLDISILRMAYRFNDAEAKFKKDGHAFFSIESIDVSIAWRELFRGRVLTDVVADGGQFFLTKPLIEGSKTPQAKPKEDAHHVINKLFPIRIAQIQLHRSAFEFADLIGQPETQRWRVTGIEGDLLNLTPTKQNPETFFVLKGTMLDSATFKMAGKAHRLDKPLAWKADLEVQDFDLVAANPMLLRLVPLTFQAGHLDLFAEVRSQHGKLEGYVKPFFKKLKVINSQEKFVSIKHFAVEVLASAVNLILRKSDDKTLAAKIPFHKENGGLKVDSMKTVQTALQHGFREPISHAVEDSLNLQ